ncbi:hypothetical protein J3F83DRAFT_712436 [Trichoderma novae-zelandiae]
MAPHALLASRGDSLDLDLDVDMGSPLGYLGNLPMATVPSNHGRPKLEGYIIAGTVVSICLVACLVAAVLVFLYLCITKARRRSRENARHRPPTPIARARARAVSTEETTAPPIPLATLPAAKLARKPLPGNTAARRPGFFSGMEVARPLQVPFLDTVIEETSSEERVFDETSSEEHVFEEAVGDLDEVKDRGEL